ncbi:MAG: hypothetical protein DRQ55_05255 [Planctomycetota bacterium]|nr:MAG: hypothetical protein DRQ55_05255 [Planctomycetota bacterium]
MTPAGAALRLFGALAALLATTDGALALWQPAGVSSFGRPAWLAVAWLLTGLASAGWVLSRRDRGQIARCLTALLLAATPFGMGALPGSAGALAPLAGTALVAAAPWIRPSFGALATGAALLLALPACLHSNNPLGAIQWALTLLPPAALVLLLPAAFPGCRARQAALLLLGATACLATASLGDYLVLMHSLGLTPLEAAATRMRPMGLHPNLAAPSIMMALLIGAALASARERRGLTLLLLLPITLALAAMQSKTGALVALGGLALLAALRARWPLARFIPAALAVVAIAALLLPSTGLTDGSITRRSASTVSKAVSFRSSMWQLGRDSMAAAPWTGNGPRTTYLQGAVAQSGRYDGLPKDDHPHNVVLAVGADLGLPGLLGLALLLAASLRRSSRPELLADAVLLAAGLHWIANGVDMGGAVRTLYPCGVLVLLGLSEAARRPGEAQPALRAAAEDTAAQSSRPAHGARSLVIGGVLLALFGARQSAQELLVVETERALAARTGSAAGGVADGEGATGGYGAVGGEGATGGYGGAGGEGAAGGNGDAHRSDSVEVPARARQLSDLSAWLLPLDPRPWGQRAAIAARSDDLAGQLAAMEQALRRAPDLAEVLRVVALLRARVDLDDPAVPTLLARALALDPYGPLAWQRHMDAALLAAHRGDEPLAREHLITAVVLNPGAVGRAQWIASRHTLRLSADGRRAVEIPLQRLFAELRRRRAELAGRDPASDARLRLREVDVLLALELTDEADAACRELLADEFTSLYTRLAQTAMLRGDHELAIEHWARSGSTGVFEARSWLLMALAQVTDPGSDAFERSLAEALPLMPDVGFQTASVRRLMEARRIISERRGLPREAARWQQAVAFLDR